MTDKLDIKAILLAAISQVRQRPVWFLLFIVRSWLGLALLVFTTFYIGFYESERTSGQLSDDYRRLAESQQALLDQSLQLTSALTNSDLEIDLANELTLLNRHAVDTLSVLGDFRAPSTPIDEARLEYREALERLVGVISRLQRGEVAGMGAALHNSLQTTTEEAAHFRTEVEDFQGSAWRRTWRSLF